MGISKLTDKFHAGRGRALKELSRRSPKAEVWKIYCSCWFCHLIVITVVTMNESGVHHKYGNIQ